MDEGKRNNEDGEKAGLLHFAAWFGTRYMDKSKNRQHGNGSASPKQGSSNRHSTQHHEGLRAEISHSFYSIKPRWKDG